MSSGSSSRPPRRDGDNRGRSAGSGRPTGKPAGKSSGRPGKAATGRSGSGSNPAKRSDPRRSDSKSGRPSSGRSSGGRTGGPSGPRSSGTRRDGRPTRPLTEAERRSLEVKARRAPREPRNPDIERQRIEDRTTEEWVDEGSVRGAASGAARRAVGGGDPAPARRQARPLDPETSAELVEALGQQRGARLSERLAQASEALDRERFQEARRIASSIAKEAPSVAAAHELTGLADYRLGRYKQAVKSLVVAQDLHENPALLPVIADCQRAQRRWVAVDSVWNEIKAVSPSHDIMAEGRMVAAGALADQDDLLGAIELMSPATKRPKTVRDFHVRQWYVLGDLHDRIGDPIAARRWFSAVADYDSEFSDVESRLRGLGR